MADCDVAPVRVTLTRLTSASGMSDAIRAGLKRARSDGHEPNAGTRSRPRREAGSRAACGYSSGLGDRQRIRPVPG
jgi:hypothetical protein